MECERKMENLTLEPKNRINSPGWIKFLASKKYNDISNLRKEFGNNVEKTECKPLNISQRNARLYIKCEHRQFSGSYNVRGALAILQKIPTETKKKGILLAAEGDEAVSFCYIAEKLFIPTTVTISSPPNWLTSIFNEYMYCSVKWNLRPEAYKDDLYPPSTQTERKRRVYIKKSDWIDTIIDAYGTLGLEIVEQLPDVNIVVLPNNDNTLIKGISWIIKNYDPAIKIVVVTIVEEFSKLDEPRVDDRATSELKDLLKDDIVDKLVEVKESCVDETIQNMYLQNILIDRASASTISAFTSDRLTWCNDEIILFLMTSGNIDISTIPKILQGQSISSGCLMAFTVQIPELNRNIRQLCEFMDKDMNVRIKELSHEQLWHSNDIIVKVICEIIDAKKYEELGNLLKSKYPSAKILYDTPLNRKNEKPERFSLKFF